MKAVGYFKAGVLDRPDALLDLEVPVPEPGALDLRVKVAAIAVNPVDIKIRLSRNPAASAPEVLGWDAVGLVDAMGGLVQGFELGDRVYYAGAIDRPGSNAEYHLVDARIVGHAPRSVSDAQAAALPLTAITAWELLFDRLQVTQGGEHGKVLLVVGAAGGVGSILVQLARQLTALTIVGTASRPGSQDWVRQLGAHYVIDHRQAFAEQLSALGLGEIDFIASLTNTDQHWKSIVQAIRPQGRISLIDDPIQPLDIMPLKRKCASLHWEFMFARSLYQTEDMGRQGEILNRVAALIDGRRVRSTLNRSLSPISAAKVREAHRVLESGQAVGKIALEGF
jgi:zinc-binding alcohol dehydrogenase family protein